MSVKLLHRATKTKENLIWLASIWSTVSLPSSLSPVVTILILFQLKGDGVSTSMTG